MGRGLVARAASHFTVHVIDNLRSGEHRLLDMRRDQFVLHHVDIRDRALIHRVVGAIQPDVIIHLAALQYIPLCEAQPQLTIETNVGGTVNLLEATPSGARFINVSSAAVYAPVAGALDEVRTPLVPQDVYGWTKLHGEQFCEYFARQRAFKVWTVRLFNVIGPGETTPHFIPDMVSQLQCGATQLSVGNLHTWRDVVDVEDVVEGLLRLALAPENALAPYGAHAAINLGTGRSYSMGQILNCLAMASGVRFEIVSDQRRVRAIDRLHMVANIERMRRALEWAPSRSLPETIARIWAECSGQSRSAPLVHVSA